MGGEPHSRTSDGMPLATTVFTDGACSGNPGPGGWAWVQPDGDWASGFDPETTNQRMELTAALGACEHFEGPLRIVSDSTYVVNCWRDRWWEGWLRRGWKNSQKQPVANRDLWERLVPHFRDRSDLELEWVKGHSGDEWNDIADRLAVGAVQRLAGAVGSGRPGAEFLGDEDAPTSGRRPGVAGPDVAGLGSGSGEGKAVAGDTVAGDTDEGGERRSAARRSADPRVPEGFLVVVAGLRDGAVSSDGKLMATLRGVIAAQQEMHGDAVVVTGLRAGAETAAAEAAAEAGVPYVVVLPYPDPAAGWPERERADFERRVDAASDAVVLEQKRPRDLEGRRASLSRRDGWLRSCADAAVIITDGSDPDAEDALRRWTKVLGEDVWRLDT